MITHRNKTLLQFSVSKAVQQLYTALIVTLNAVAWKSFELVAWSKAESVAQPLDLADTILHSAVKYVPLTAGHDGVLWLHEEPFALHHTLTHVHHYHHLHHHHHHHYTDPYEWDGR